MPWPDYPKGLALTDVEVPEDFVLRECLAVDADDMDAVVAFVQQWGSLCPFDGRPTDASLPASTSYTRTDEGVSGRGDVRDQSVYLRTLQAVAGHYVAESLGHDVAAVWRSHGLPIAGNQDMSAWLQFSEFLNAALGVFPMYVTVDGIHGGVGLPQPTTYEVAMLQLVQLLAQDRRAKTCHNDRCNKVYTLQRGRRKYDASTGHATGVKYCSAQCAKAQAERKRRAKRRNERNEGRRTP